MVSQVAVEIYYPRTARLERDFQLGICLKYETTQKNSNKPLTDEREHNLICIYLTYFWLTLWVEDTINFDKSKGRHHPPTANPNKHIMEIHQANRKLKTRTKTIWSLIKVPVTFHYTGWFIGILVVAYDNPSNVGTKKALWTELMTDVCSCWKHNCWPSS